MKEKKKINYNQLVSLDADYTLQIKIWGQRHKKLRYDIGDLFPIT